VLLIITQSACSKESKNKPSVTSVSVTDITRYSATLHGNVTNDMGETIVARGACWSTGSNPTIANNKTNVGGKMWEFTSPISGLTPNTKYYVRAYCTLRNPDDASGTGYGAVLSFTTLP
jgi:hypothetical protein